MPHSQQATEPRLSASTALAPPCSRPKYWRLCATGMVPTTRSGSHSVILMPIRSISCSPAQRPSTSAGQTTTAVYRFTSMLINLLRDGQPSHVAAAFDGSRKTFRAEAYAPYKANRSTTPDEFRGQVSLIHEVLGTLGIPVLTKENYEADDLIATLVTRAEAAGFQVLICTGDRDALQLVSDQVTVLYPRKGVSDLTRFTPDEVAERYG